MPSKCKGCDSVLVDRRYDYCAPTCQVDHLLRRLRELQDEVRSLRAEREALADKVAKHLEFTMLRRDTNDESTYCAECGNQMKRNRLCHDGDCAVEIVRSFLQAGSQ